MFPFPFTVNGIWSWWQFLNQMEFHLVQNRKENWYHDHIPFNVEGNGNIVFSVYLCHRLVASTITPNLHFFFISDQVIMKYCRRYAPFGIIGGNQKPHDPLEHRGNIVPRGLRWALNFVFIMPRDASIYRITEESRSSLALWNPI